MTATLTVPADLAAMQDVLRELTTEQVASLLSYMQACEPACFEAAVAYVARPGFERGGPR
jgi:hypothetical protein